MSKLKTQKVNFNNSGQALVALLVFMMVGLAITSTSVSLLVANSQSAQKFQDAQVALAVAEGGIENALIRLLRNPNYAGETLTVGEGTATVTVTGTNPMIVRSVGESGNFQRTITVELAATTSGIMNISSWEETYD